MKPIYVRAGKVIDDVRAIAREHGYAIAVHGSQRPTRDIDLVAVPWTKNAHAFSTLVRAIKALPYLNYPKRERPTPKPHGRLATVFIITHRHGTCPAYVDLSVMPRQS